MSQLPYCDSNHLDFCGSGIQQQSTVFVCALVVVFCIWVGVKLTNAWLSKIDFYPLKQKSPLLSLDLLLVFLLSVCAYPAQIIVTYFAGQDDYSTPLLFNLLYFSTRYVAYFIYLMRAIRIYYAYNVQKTDSFVFKQFFGNERRMTLLVYLLMGARLIPFYLNFSGGWRNKQALLFPSPITYYRECTISPEMVHLYMIRKYVQEFPWQIILLACVWLVKKVESSLGYFKEYSFILLLNLALNLGEIVYFFLGYQNSSHQHLYEHARSYFQGNCSNLASLSMSQLVIMVHNVCMLLISVIYPRTQIESKHHQLPIQITHELENSMKCQLLLPNGYANFKLFLTENAKTNHAEDKYLQYLDIWTRIVQFREGQPNWEEIHEFIKSLNDSDIISSHLMNELNQTVVDYHEMQGAHQKSMLNAALDALDRQAVENLLRIYKQKYIKTVSHRSIRMIFKRNFRVNNNMYQLRMTERPIADESEQY